MILRFLFILWILLVVGFTAFLIFLIENSASAHEWYSDLKVPGSNASCCNERDCRSLLQMEVRNGEYGLEVFVFGKWVIVPPEMILAEPSPDSETHFCGTLDSSLVPPKVFVRCVVLPSSM